MSPVATVNSVTLSPEILYGELNITNLCLTAHVTDDLNNPVEGVLVNFFVTGINPLFGFYGGNSRAGKPLQERDLG
jgi:hypothetical protein